MLFFFLYLLSLLYRMILQFWILLYAVKILRPKVLPKCVISVGNITVGGTGKTPTVLALARFFQEHGKKVAILSRGYGRTGSHSIEVVSDGNQVLTAPDVAGEEAYFLAKELKGVIVAVGKNRFHTGLFLLKKYEIDLFILDDGFQHLKIHRDTNILLLDSKFPFGNNFLLPRGILREPASSIKRSSLIFLTSKGNCENRTEKFSDRLYASSIPLYSVCFVPSCFLNMLTGERYTGETLRGKAALLVSGIGNPRSFRNLVEDFYIEISRELIFPDHHIYRTHDIDAIYDIASSRKVDFIITTDKDAVKLCPYLRKEVPVLILKLEFKTGLDFPWDALLSGKV